MSQAVMDVEPRPAVFLRLAWTKLEARMLLLTIGIAIVMTFISPYFLTAGNLLNLLDQSIGVSIIAIGMTFVILTGGIDLSVGSIVGFTAFFVGTLIANHNGMNPLVAVMISILIGAALGAVAWRRHRLWGALLGAIIGFLLWIGGFVAWKASPWG